MRQPAAEPLPVPMNLEVGAVGDLDIVGVDGDQRACTHRVDAASEGQASAGKATHTGPGGGERGGASDGELVLRRAVAEADGVGADGHECPSTDNVGAGAESQAVAGKGGKIGPGGCEGCGAGDGDLVLRSAVAEADGVGGHGHECPGAHREHPICCRQARTGELRHVAPAGGPLLPVPIN